MHDDPPPPSLGAEAPSLPAASTGLSVPDTSFKLKDQIDYALKHFLFVADQRLKTFQFYAALLAAVSGATITAMSAEKFNNHIFFMIGCAHMILALIFWAIERRNIGFLELSKDTLLRLESKIDFPLDAQIFTHDIPENKTRLQRLLSYRAAFNFTYGVQLMFGILIVYCAAFVPHSKSESQADLALPPKLSNQASPPAATKNNAPFSNITQGDSATSETPASDATSTSREEIFIMNRVIEKK